MAEIQVPWEEGIERPSTNPDEWVIKKEGADYLIQLYHAAADSIKKSQNLIWASQNSDERISDAAAMGLDVETYIQRLWTRNQLLAATRIKVELEKYIERLTVQTILVGAISRKRAAEILGVHQATTGRWVKEYLAEHDDDPRR